jgi:lipopolysaccharide biosynthesis glycosyltransferase
MKKNILITLADRKYLNQAKQLFSSVYFNAGWKGDYMLFAHEIPEKELKCFRDKGILVKKCRPLTNITKKPWDLVTLDKFYLFTEDMKKWENILFIDVDIIVRASLENLTKIKGFSAVMDFYQTLREQFLKNGKYKKLKENLGNEYDLNSPGFNSGVMAFSSDIIKKQTFSNLKSLAKKYINFSKHGEQGILNLYFYKKWKNLPISFNFNPLCITNPWRNKKPINLGIIWHFPGTKKPWEIHNSYLYNEWNTNLKKFDSINLQNPINNLKKYTLEEILKQSICIKKRILFYSPLLFIDNLVGRTGIFLKKYFPKFYYFLKNQTLPK